jgi:hypothetical protein
MTRSLAASLAALALVVFVGAPSVAAQSLAPQPVNSTAPSAGWTVTPSFALSNGWDDNLFFSGNNDSRTGDLVTVLNPRGNVAYSGRRTQLTGDYNGGFVLYRALDGLNSFDQQSSVYARHQISRRLAVVGSHTLSITPTTANLLLVDVPFVRTGSTINDLHGGIDATLTKRTSVSASAHLDWTRFDQDRPLALILRGGFSQGGSVSARHILTKRTALTADYALDHATVGDGFATFNVANASVGFERQLADHVRVFAAGGFSHLGTSQFGPARNGPSYRGGIVAQLKYATVDAGYSRSYIPSFGFGGTTQNEDLTGRLSTTLSRRLYATSLFAWRRNEPLTAGELKLRSISADAVVGYLVHPLLHVEGFYSVMSQEIARPGGDISRRRIGFQVVTSKPLRMR